MAIFESIMQREKEPYENSQSLQLVFQLKEKEPRKI